MTISSLIKKNVGYCMILRHILRFRSNYRDIKIVFITIQEVIALILYSKAKSG